ncbi:putative RDD family membrane protein YckC [Nocardia tenerifensis]|uniref:Putative RDD family membrane protein YckC n=1 Tax=Nocardia tenerifensis TaxID=228006 RepID=A0A318JW79_9NOCA|nr:RDD family protein [Nocardia tenerifensis]PXX58749.1 putative RDD family membrane protein YckC [Nocardia tenerifensis]
MAALLASVTHYRIADYLSDWPGLAQSGGWDLFRANGDWGGAGKAFGRDVFGEILLLIGEAFVVLVLSVFAYQFAALAWKGRTLGKFLLDIRVHSLTDSRGRLSRWQAARRAAASTVVDVGLYSAACVALLAGKFVLSLVLWVAAVSALVLNAVPLAGGRTAIDRLAGTTVVRAGLYRKSWQAARDAAILERGTQGAQVGMERVQAVTDAMKQQAQQLAEDERLRRLRESARSAPLRRLGQDAGRHTGEAARQLLDSDRGQQAQDAAKRVGANLRAAYGKRRRTRS